MNGKNYWNIKEIDIMKHTFYIKKDSYVFDKIINVRNTKRKIFKYYKNGVLNEIKTFKLAATKTEIINDFNN